MNYRHAYHAGNFGDCLKHALLLWILRALQRKPAPLTVLETHAGAGAYDLTAGPAARTGEWRGGIGKLKESAKIGVDDPLGQYLAAVGSAAEMPGSPLLVQKLLRPRDRLICCELHPEEFAALARRLRSDPRVALHQRDGWEALGALLPPKPARGIVFIDPPYEQPNEFERLSAGIRLAHRRWQNGVLAAWYPIKHRTPVNALFATLERSGIPNVVAAELTLREPTDPKRLNGAGVIVVNPPYGFEPAAGAILKALHQRLGTGERGGGGTLRVIVSEEARGAHAKMAGAEDALAKPETR